MKTKIFVGSSREGLAIAYAIQQSLAYDADVSVWTQDIFKLSSNTLDDLIVAARKSDFAIFVFKPDDLLKIRQAKHKVARDNVIFETGLFIGSLGKSRVFFVIPENASGLHLPTDLLGFNPGTYNSDRFNEEPLAAVSTFTNQVRVQIAKFESSGLGKVGYFQDFNDKFSELFKKAKHLSLYFIHSRSWRENHDTLLHNFLIQKDSRVAVFLPNILNRQLMDSIKANFEDGSYIEPLIKDAINFFHIQQTKFPKKVDIKLFNHFPTYSFYKFDSNLIVAMYPTTMKKRNVPTFEFKGTNGLNFFFSDEYNSLMETSTPLSKEHLEYIKL